MEMKTLNDILKLRIEIPKYHVVEWFEVLLCSNSILIKSGLNHADGKTKSPYFYEEFTFGKNYKKKAIKKFNEFLKNINE